LRLNQNDTVDEFDTIDEAVIKRDELINNDPTLRIYKIVERIDGNYLDINI
jgi:hypothetical protein